MIENTMATVLENDATVAYLEEIQMYVLACLVEAITKDPLSDIVVMATRVDDESQIVALPRANVIELLRGLKGSHYQKVADRITQLPGSISARWVVIMMDKPNVCSACSVVPFTYSTNSTDPS